MKKRKVITNLPLRVPYVGTMVWILFLDRFQAPGWVWGAIGVVWAILMIASVADTCTAERVDLFAEKGDKK